MNAIAEVRNKPPGVSVRTPRTQRRTTAKRLVSVGPLLTNAFILDGLLPTRYNPLIL
ncbi:MAG TPA: hypothetical protein VGR53_11155 [Nitrososphaerales archaeon]|nr:hypothetical protein [Nitrososphaerales archaeon]